MAAEQAKKLLGAREDWDDWYTQLKDMIPREIWPYINLEVEIQPLVDPPVLSDVRKFAMARVLGEPQVEYSDLTVIQRNNFENACRYYDRQQKAYITQAAYLEKARNAIIDTTTIETCKSLDTNRPVREWLEFLIDIFRPSRDHMQTEAKRRYHEFVYQNLRTKIGSWLKQ